MIGAIATPTTTWYLLLGAVLFSIGVVGVMVRRNPLVLFMCIELMLNAVNLTFVALARRMGDIGGQSVVFFVMVVAAAEVVEAAAHLGDEVAHLEGGFGVGLVDGERADGGGGAHVRLLASCFEHVLVVTELVTTDIKTREVG